MQHYDNNDEDILTTSDKGMSSAKDVLSGLWRSILYSLGMNPLRWKVRMDKMMLNPRFLLAARGKSKPSLRGNLRKALLKDRMSWKQFERGLVFLGPTGAKFAVYLTWPDGRETVHEWNVDLSQVNMDVAGSDDTEENDELEQVLATKPASISDRLALQRGKRSKRLSELNSGDHTDDDSESE